MIRKLYDWAIDLAQKPFALSILFFYAAAEASFFPLPVELLLIPMIIARPSEAFRIVAVATLGSCIGAAIGYGIGALVFDYVAKPILEFYGYMSHYEGMAEFYNQYEIWAVFIGGLTIIPFKVITIFSGATGMNFALFMILSLIARAIRYGVIGILLYYYGEPIRLFIEKYLSWIFLGGIVLVAFGFYLLGVH